MEITSRSPGGWSGSGPNLQGDLGPSLGLGFVTGIGEFPLRLRYSGKANAGKEEIITSSKVCQRQRGLTRILR